MLDTAKTVREIAVEMPHATRVFEKLGIDYCCGGGKTLEQACEAANIGVSAVVESLNATTVPDTGNDWNTASLAALVNHIVETHHNYVKSETPRIDALLAKVCSVHGSRHPELFEVQKMFRELGAELASHMMKEEQILFPYIVRAEEANVPGRRPTAPPFGTVRNPIQMMIMEHDSAGDLLREIRSVTQDYTPPADGCISYQTLYRALLEYEADLHQHIHLENNLLFPRAIAMENGN